MKLIALYIDRDVANSPVAASIRDRLNIPSMTVGDAQEIYRSMSAVADPVQTGKSVLFLTQNKGSFIKKCPGTRFYTCCGYQILHIGTFCSMDCSYCILQQYFHPPLLQLFTNHQDLFDDLDRLLANRIITRIGTGEFTDSLIWENLTDLSTRLVQRFSVQSHAVLELKTKTADVQNLKGLDHNQKTIVAWSLNTETVIRREERRTASLAQRLRAAKACEALGYPIAFHFDPIIIYDEWEKDYRNLVKQVFSQVSGESIVWISLGALRFVPPLKSIIRQRFSDSTIIYGEFVPGLDGKMRYFKPLRIKLYQKMVGWIREIAPETLVYLCMEDDEVWKKSFGFIPGECGGLSRMLDKSAKRHCGLA